MRPMAGETADVAMPRSPARVKEERREAGDGGRAGGSDDARKPPEMDGVSGETAGVGLSEVLRPRCAAVAVRLARRSGENGVRDGDAMAERP